MGTATCGALVLVGEVVGYAHVHRQRHDGHEVDLGQTPQAKYLLITRAFDALGRLLDAATS